MILRHGPRRVRPGAPVRHQRYRRSNSKLHRRRAFLVADGGAAPFLTKAWNRQNNGPPSAHPWRPLTVSALVVFVPHLLQPADAEAVSVHAREHRRSRRCARRSQRTMDIGRQLLQEQTRVGAGTTSPAPTPKVVMHSDCERCRNCEAERPRIVDFMTCDIDLDTGKRYKPRIL